MQMQKVAPYSSGPSGVLHTARSQHRQSLHGVPVEDAHRHRSALPHLTWQRIHVTPHLLILLDQAQHLGVCHQVPASQQPLPLFVVQHLVPATVDGRVITCPGNSPARCSAARQQARSAGSARTSAHLKDCTVVPSLRVVHADCMSISASLAPTCGDGSTPDLTAGSWPPMAARPEGAALRP
jgi:hypothetical protein